MNIPTLRKAVLTSIALSIAMMHAPAQATLDFNSNTFPVVLAPGSIESGGFTFASGQAVGVVNGSLDGYQYGVRNNTPMLVFSSDADNALTVSQSGGGSFSLSSLDAGRWLGLDQSTGPTASPNAALSITGYTGVGSQEILATPSLPYGNDFTSFTIAPQFASLSFQSLSIRITGYSFSAYAAIDNLVLTPIPEPETYGMMLAGLGLLALAGRRRKQQAAR